jgi:hypothetical protein
MKTDNKHFKCINSHTGNAIFYYSVDDKKDQDQTQAELDKVRAQVAMQNAMPVTDIYWQEIKNTN